MSFNALHTSLALSPTAQFVSRLEPIASTVLPFFMINPGPSILSSAGKAGIAAAIVLNGGILAGLGLNEFAYFTSTNPTQEIKLIHECNRILMLAFFVNSFVKAYQTGSWKPLRPLILYAPLLAAIGKSHPIFRIISEVPTKKTKKQPIKQLEDLMAAKRPFVIYSEDYSLEEIHSLIHAFNKKDKKGYYPYKIFSLSLWELIGCGAQWKERLIEVFDYLKTQGEVILMIDQFDRTLQMKGDTVTPYSFLINAKLPNNIKLIGISKNSIFLDIIPTEQIFKVRKSSKSKLPAKLVKIPDDTPLVFQREEAQHVLEVLGNQHGVNRVCLVGEEEYEKELLMASIAHLLKDAKPPLEGTIIYSVHFTDLLDEKNRLQSTILKSVEDANIILYVHSIEDGFGLAHMGESVLFTNLRTLLNHPKIKLIVSASQEQFETLRKDHTPFERTFAFHKMEPLKRETETALFEKEKERYPDTELSADLKDKILAITGPLSIREQCSLLGQVVSIMSQRSCSEEEALGVIKVQVSHQSRSFLPPNLIELTSSSEDVICLEREREVLQILVTLHSKDGKNNVCLVGDAGCGKTQLVRFIASSIKREECHHFEDYRVFSFSVSSIMSGSTYLGMWQGKLRKILEFCQSHGKAIVFIDEIHLTIGNGKSLGNDTMDIAQMMKEYITDPDLRIIGATTPAEYHKYVEQDPAFADRFKVMELAPLSEQSQLKALTAHSLKHSITGEALPEEALQTILDQEGGSLRTSVGRVAEVHAYMNYMESKDVNAAIDWTRGQGKITPTLFPKP